MITYSLYDEKDNLITIFDSQQEIADYIGRSQNYIAKSLCNNNGYLKSFGYTVVKDDDGERKTADIKKYQSEYYKRYSIKHDRSEYQKEYYKEKRRRAKCKLTS